VSAVAARRAAGSQAAGEWAQVAAQAPQMADTLGRYLSQSATFLAPNSVDAADLVLRQLAGWLLEHTEVRSVADIARGDIEDFKLWLRDRPGMRGEGLAQNTQRQRLRMLRVFFERLIEWDWADAPTRNPIIGRDIPPRPEPLPKFLDDRDAARLMTAARAATDPRDRLVVEVLARTGLRSSELCNLDATPSCSSETATGCASPSASCATTVTSHCTPTSSPCSPPGPPPTSTTSATIAVSSPTTAAPSTVTLSDESSAELPATPASVSTPTNCATPWPPKRSTAACASKRSPPSSGTARWR
jgi:Phage integrase, N-terminal SAM-like domain